MKYKLGSLMESFFMTLRIFSFLSTVAIVIVLYANIQPFLLRYIPWITLWYFMSILAGVGLSAMALVHRLLMPIVRAHQSKHDRLERIEKLLTELVKKENE